MRIVYKKGLNCLENTIAVFGIKMFDNIAMQLNLQSLGKSSNVKITKEEFEDLCKNFLFEQIKGNNKFGVYFCEKYNEPNNVLMILPNESAKEHIKKFYVK